MNSTCSRRRGANRRTNPLSGCGEIAVYSAVRITTIDAPTAATTLAPIEAAGPRSLSGCFV